VTDPPLHRFTMTGSAPTLNGAGRLKVQGNFDWGGGTMDGPGTTTFEDSATVTLGSTAAKYVQGGRAVNNRGTVNWVDGQVIVQGGGSVTNGPGGTFHILGSQYLWGLTNEGTLTKSGPGAAEIGYLANSGVVDIHGGTLVVRNGPSSGLFQADGGATLDFRTRNNYEAITLDPGVRLEGDGQFQLNLFGFGSRVNLSPGPT
jgi:hypothetical protein